MNAPILDRVNELVEPFDARALAITTFALWATLGILVLALPVVVLALLVAVLT